jgi:integrase
MANTGMRRNEARQLRVSRVDLNAGHVDVVSSAEARTKSGKWRRIPLSRAAIEALEVLLSLYGSTGYVLPRITAPSLSRAFAHDCEVLGLSGSLHSLRHSYGAHMVMAGVPLRSLQVLMGHASFKTTERYAHIGEDHLKAQARLVNL